MIERCRQILEEFATRLGVRNDNGAMACERIAQLEAILENYKMFEKDTRVLISWAQSTRKDIQIGSCIFKWARDKIIELEDKAEKSYAFGCRDESAESAKLLAGMADMIAWQNKRIEELEKECRAIKKGSEVRIENLEAILDTMNDA